MTSAFMLYLDRNSFAKHWCTITKFAPIKCENRQACTVLCSADVIIHNMTPGTHLGRRRSWFFSTLLTPVWFLFVAVAGQWLMKLRYEVQLVPRHSQLGKLHPSCKDHPHPVSLKWWLGSVEATCLHPRNFLYRESPVWKKVLLLWSRLLKNASNSLCMRDVKCYETRCNAAKSINFQLSHAPQSSIILFSM